MHPNPAYRWMDEAAMRSFVAHHALAQISAVVSGTLMTAQAPLAVHPDGSIRFHLARANPLTSHLDGTELIAAVFGETAYVSPDWYGSEDQVPTWNYRLVEISGHARRLDQAQLVDQLDQLSAVQEGQLAPKLPWTSAKLSPARMAKLLNAVTGFAIDRPTLLGCAKLGQDKASAEQGGVVAALVARGNPAMAGVMSAATSVDPG